MSIETWKAEFYATDAEETSAHEAMDHSIVKWEGLSKKNLDRHGVRKDARDSRLTDDEGDRFSIYGGTCALCVHFESQGECTACSLSQARGGVRCDMQRLDESVSPYFAFVCDSDPQPMLKWLKKAKRFEQARDKAAAREAAREVAAKKAAPKKAAARKRVAK